MCNVFKTEYLSVIQLIHHVSILSHKTLEDINLTLWIDRIDNWGLKSIVIWECAIYEESLAFILRVEYSSINCEIVCDHTISAPDQTV